MKTVMLVGSLLMMFVSVFMAIRQIKDKKPITDPYLILSILTFLIALRMIGKMIGL